MNAGDLNRRITVLRRSAGVDSFNEPVDTWTSLTTVWASMTPISDGERLRAGETLAQRAARFVIRYSATAASVDPRDRLTFDGDTYEINGVKEISRREFLEITATARADA